MAHRRASSGGRVVLQKRFAYSPSSFSDFFTADATFVDKTLAIEAFLRYSLGHHLILRPRRCGKSYTLSMIRDFLQRPTRPTEQPYFRDITKSKFDGTAIADPDHAELVDAHFKKYPVLSIDFKDVRGATFEDLLASFDSMIASTVDQIINPFNGIVDPTFVDWCRYMSNSQTLQIQRDRALRMISSALQGLYKQAVVVLIDEYDSPMNSAIENGYAHRANEFFATVFGSLLKGNEAVCASMMVGICKVARSGWLSQLNNVEIFSMHAKDDRYANFFLFAEQEVEMLCGAQGQMSIATLKPHYNGYTARSSNGPVKLYNPLSVIKALAQNCVSNFWVETGRYAPLSQKLWCASADFRSKLDILLTQKRVELIVDDHVNFFTYDTISDSGLWGLLYYTGYLTVETYAESSLSTSTFRIPNAEVTSEWQNWVVDYLNTTTAHSSLLGVYDVIVNGDAEGFQRQFTAFLQEYLSLYCAPYHKEKVYQALCYMLIFALFSKKYDVRMEQDDGHGRSDITAHPFSQGCDLLLIFEIKAVAMHRNKSGKRSLKTADRLENDLQKAKHEALAQIERRRYRERAPLHTTRVHEYAFAFSGKFCVAAVRTLERDVTGNWQEVTNSNPATLECMVDKIDDEDVDNED